MACPDLCTAAKCEELERRIEALEQALELLEASFEAHTQQDIPEAHKYKPAWDVEVNVLRNEIFVGVTIDSDTRYDTAVLPEHRIDVEAQFTSGSNLLRIDVRNGVSSDFALVEIPIPEILEIPEPVEHIESNLRLSASFFNEVLTLSVADGESQDTAQVSIPLPEIPEPVEHIESNLRLSASFFNEVLTLSVADGESQDTAQVQIPLPEPTEHVESNLKISASWQSEILTISVADGESQDTAQVQIPLPEPTEHVESNLKLNGIFQSEILTLTVADGESQDTVQISIPKVELPEPEIDFSFDMSVQGNTLGVGIIFDGESIFKSVELPVFQPFVVVDVFERDNNNFVVKVSVNGESDEDILTIDIPDMNCDQLEEKFDLCCSKIINALNDLSLQLTNAESIINQSVDEVYREITIDMEGTARDTYKCTFPKKDDGTLIPTYAESENETIIYNGKGLKGLQKQINLISNNLRDIHSDVCKAIPPISNITKDDLYRYCFNNPNVDRSQYFNERGIEKYTGAALQYKQIVESYLQNLLIDSKYGYLLDNAVEENLITAPTHYIAQMTADFALIQGRINNKAICDIKIPEDPEVVSILVNDRIAPVSEDKYLVLHFVTEGNYPKRKRNSSYWEITIPAAKDSYTWDSDFKDLRFYRGNQYAELKFNEFKNPVSGFFANKDVADAYFDKVLKLTTATEKNRGYPKHKYPQTNVVERITRPYRAFLESTNNAGQAVCHIKYVPTPE